MHYINMRIILNCSTNYAGIFHQIFKELCFNYFSFVVFNFSWTFLMSSSLILLQEGMQPHTLILKATKSCIDHAQPMSETPFTGHPSQHVANLAKPKGAVLLSSLYYANIFESNCVVDENFPYFLGGQSMYLSICHSWPSVNWLTEISLTVILLITTSHSYNIKLSTQSSLVITCFNHY